MTCHAMVTGTHTARKKVTVVSLVVYLWKWVPVAARSKARNIFDHSNTGIAGSDPARGMDMSAFFCVVLSCLV